VSEVSVTCSCGNRFEVAKSFKGGLVNCPKCAKATSVPSGPEPVFLAMIAILVVCLLLATYAAWAVMGPVAGIIAFLIGAGVVIAIIMAS